MLGLDPGGAELLVDFVGDGLDLARVGARAENEIVGEAAGLGVELQDADVGGLLLRRQATRPGQRSPELIAVSRLGIICPFPFSEVRLR